ncbi:hypothetical protein [Allorhodopirellula solitaria]|uniref:VWFA domain-containing protein n=1 Tax=Allorhodopirellula solitaria TaxID=2527987 RepID=A0A5C5XT99_9BACT|nr:hypothetical protein [Allorhodopirellula solitaria]TWT65235.1 hypothetical protein CA85_31470 [Allorhodopirellula solitaria]
MTSPESGRSFQPPAGNPPTARHRPIDPASAPADEEPIHRQRATVLHELARVRREAEAARLEARASRLDASAEQLEFLLKRIDSGVPLSPVQLREIGIHGDSSSGDDLEPASPGSAVRFDSWQAVRQAQLRSEPQRMPSGLGGAEHLRQDGPHESLQPPRMRRRTDRESDVADPSVMCPSVVGPGGSDPGDSGPDDGDPGSQDGEAEGRATPTTPSPAASPSSKTSLPGSPPRAKTSKEARAPQGAEASDRAAIATEKSPLGQSSLDQPLVVAQPGDGPPRRRRSTAVIASAIIHLVLLLCLAGFTLHTVMPKDQIALAASSTQNEEQTIETFEMETVQPESLESETAPEEAAVEVDPLGDMPMANVSADALGSSPVPSQSFAGATAASGALKTLASNSDSKMQFCGVEGGGNHFVYLVDSSGSMGDAFLSARRALLDSIDMLSPEQRFYVIFFDAECDYMRISRADQDEPRSVYASPSNKQRLRSWAMRVEMDRGKAPYEPLEYALQDLKPDVIFLLSDGEFPQRIESLLQTENRVANLFGEIKPVSIIHTISYHSREGESRMRRIAESNFGQYRHVPKP